MSKNSSADSIYIGVCKCCLNDGSYMDMWGEYFFNGEREVYGDMLAECFGYLLQESPDTSEGVELICEACVKRLRDAFHFRNLVLASTTTMNNLFKMECKEEREELIKIEDDDNYEEVEYLEDALEPEIHPGKPEDENKTPAESTRKWPKKKKPSERRSYRNYSAADLKKCVELVRGKKLSTNKACKLYNIPRSSLQNKIRTEKKAESGVVLKPEAQLREKNHEKQRRFVTEVKQLLSVTNATIYRTRATRLHCAYCSAPAFLSAAAFRDHMRVAHRLTRVSHAHLAMRPYWFYEVVKLDIDNLRCTECDLAVPRWPDLFRHLAAEHDLHFRELEPRLIPYVLDGQNRCALCDLQLKNYHLLDGHMNSHYGNHVCNKCGDTFMTTQRLQKHVEIHDYGRFPCDLCGKVFTLDKYMRKHRRQFHAAEPYMKCLHCDDKFSGSYARHLHVVKQHREVITSITCELCGKTFNWSPFYFAHMRRKHGPQRQGKKKVKAA